MIDISTVKNIHFIGIGGVSNSAIAEILNRNGYKVSGSDLRASSFTQHLQQQGIEVFIGHQASNVENAELVIYTSAASDDNPELTAAMEKGSPCLSRAEMLGQLMLGYSDSIAIAGTHGKTTTTSMVTRIFNDSKHDPTALVGGYFEDIKSNVRIGASQLFITEACEYKENFLAFYPKVGVILNIDEDHLDYYRDLDQIVNAFVKFSENIQDNGLLILNGDDYNAKKVIPYYKGKLKTFGLSDNCDYIAKNITYNHMGCASFDVFHGEGKLTKIDLTVPGQHNVYNALAAFVTGIQFSDDVELISTRLNSFKNANRRFEYIGKTDLYTVVDDYAHHPNEIKATLDAATRIESVNRIRCIFQPHTYSRTKELLHGFSSAFGSADEIILCDIYAAREVDHGDIHSNDLLKALESEHKSVKYFDSFDEIVTYVKSNAQKGDLIITMGAGDVTEIGAKLLSE